jgi:hypothetical protein
MRQAPSSTTSPALPIDGRPILRRWKTAVVIDLNDRGGTIRDTGCFIEGCGELQVSLAVYAALFS